LARLGGDEFGALLECCDLQDAETIAERLLSAIESHHFHWQGQVFKIGLSIGLVHIQGISQNISELFSAADAACYMAKEQGRNRLHTFRPDDQELARRRGEMGWVQHIHAAIDNNRFRLYRQKILPLSNGRVDERDHFEILLRMIDKNGSLVTPNQFVSAAERYNLMPTIDRRVISNTLEWLSKSDNQQTSVGLCSINISGFSVTDPQTFSFIQEQLAIHKVAPDIICFEITETAAISNLARAANFMEKVHALGCRFALDDFGSGMSSYGYLKKLPVDFLKIDGEFVRDIVTDEVSLAMVRSIHEIGHVMGKQTIAEYVEDRQILTVLKVIGIDFAQGNEIEKPRPLV
jgi:EAL domain-containing protein (putative c-di-GMP-specific phosphodiesterase class I)